MNNLKVGDKVQEKEWMGQFKRNSILFIRNIEQVNIPSEYPSGFRVALDDSADSPESEWLYDDSSNCIAI